MIVCHCKRVCDRQIRRAVREGACSPGEVSRACAAGTRCGGCRPAIEEIVRGELAGGIAQALLSPAEVGVGAR